MYFDKCDHHSGVYTLRFATKRLLPTRLILMDGYWYCTAFDLTKETWRTYRCDFMASIVVETPYQTLYAKRGVAGFVPEANANLSKHSLQG